MSSPVSVGDAIAVLGTLYAAYNAYRTLPGDLKDILTKVADVKDELESLNQVLQHSRRKKYRTYPKTDELLLAIDNAKLYLNKYQPLIENGSVRMKVKSTFQARWNDAEIQRHVKKMDKFTAHMRDFKHTVAVQATFDNTETALGTASLVMQAAGISLREPPAHTVRDDASTITSDDADTLCKAQRTLKLYNAIDSSLSPIIEASPRSPAVDELRSLQRFKLEVESIVERRGLYKLRPLPAAKLQYLDELGRLADSVQPHRERSTPENMKTLTPLVSPVTVGGVSNLSMRSDPRPTSIVTPNTTPGDDVASISQSWKHALQLVDERDAPKASNGFLLTGPALELHESELIGSDSDSSDPTEMLDDHFVLPRPIMLITPWSGQKFPCTLSIRQSEGSLQLEAKTVKSYLENQISAPTKRTVASPAAFLDLSAETADAVRASDGTQIVFTHALLGGLGSFPRILHPKAEKDLRRPDTYPYGIEFYTHQYLKVAGYDKLPKAVKGLGYLFQTKEDRDLVREKMFGKKLLASVGISTIQYDKKSRSKPCGTQPITLWRDQKEDFEDGNGLAVDRTDSKTLLSITVQCNSQGKHTEPDSAMEFAVLSAKGIDKVRVSEGRWLDLKLYTLNGVDTNSPGSPVAGGALPSDVSAFSHASDYSQSIASTSPASRRSSFLSRKLSTSTVTSASNATFHCFVKFTEGSEEFIRQKKRFLDTLKENLPS